MSSRPVPHERVAGAPLVRHPHRHGSTHKSPDMIVANIAMPDLNGLDLIVVVRSNDEFANLPVVAITYFGEDICELARAAGATDAIDKPTELEGIREVIEAAVSRSSSARHSSMSDKNYTTGATAGPAIIPPRASSWN